MRASKALGEEGLAVLALSRFYATPCFPAGAGPDYVNARRGAGLRRQKMTQRQFWRVCMQVEARFGRKRMQRWGMRTLDIDLLAVGDSVLPDAETQDAWRNLAADGAGAGRRPTG